MNLENIFGTIYITISIISVCIDFYLKNIKKSGINYESCTGCEEHNLLFLSVVPIFNIFALAVAWQPAAFEDIFGDIEKYTEELEAEMKAYQNL